MSKDNKREREVIMKETEKNIMERRKREEWKWQRNCCL